MEENLPSAPLESPPSGLTPPVLQARAILKDYTLQRHIEGATTAQISEECGIDEDTLRRWRREEGMIPPRAPRGHSRLEAYTAEIKQAWDAGELLRVIAPRYGTTVAKISTFAKRMGWPRRPPTSGRGPRRRILNGLADEVKVLWDQGLPLLEIGKRYGMSDTAIRALAVRRGWPPRNKDGAAAREELIFQLLHQGLSVRGVARNVPIARGSILRIMRRRGWRTRPGASDQRASAPTPQEEAVVPRRPGPLRAPRIPEPTGLSPEVSRARAVLKDFALRINQHGATHLDTCEACGICEDTLARFRREEGLSVVPAPKGQFWMDRHIKELREAWERDDDERLEELAARCGVGPTQISEFASLRGWPQRSRGRKRGTPNTPPHVLLPHVDAIRELWDAGLTGVEMARRFRVSPTTMLNFARRQQFPRRLTPRERHEELVFQCIYDGLSVRATARLLGLARYFVAGLVRDRGWRPAEPPPEAPA